MHSNSKHFIVLAVVSVVVVVLVVMVGLTTLS